MKDIKLAAGAFVVSMFFVPCVWAVDYPAADFQPKVVYRDPSIAEFAPAPANTAAPVNVATPCVNQQQSEVDPKYPAANFQPKVVYSGTGS
ncbi:hypothetical protein NP603_19290 [Methylomonas sp. SURF-1]|uniref:Uncharacterized protein n=1 Tax=Methylomonas aurea TaxID=2952224 RepID=A0ABT1UMJ6_9GAMM|nr:hypothetical protein [Methylomonas sp. SURF-1]MCQ8183266.1 hypothetical protein [Methylomonas sp. SURF-1]